MTPWDKMHDRMESVSPQDRRSWIGIGIALVIAVVLLVALASWAIWPLTTAAIWLLLIGSVVFVAVHLALRRR